MYKAPHLGAVIPTLVQASCPFISKGLPSQGGDTDPEGGIEDRISYVEPRPAVVTFRHQFTH